MRENSKQSGGCQSRSAGIRMLSRDGLAGLARSEGISLTKAEEEIGLGKDYFAKAFRGIVECTLEEAVKISRYFNTTVDSILFGGAGGGPDTRVQNRYTSDTLSSEYYKECLKLYANLLEDKARNFKYRGLMDNEIMQDKVSLERAEMKFCERRKNFLDEIERKMNMEKATELSDEDLIKIMEKRGFNVEKKNLTEVK